MNEEMFASLSKEERELVYKFKELKDSLEKFSEETNTPTQLMEKLQLGTLTTDLDELKKKAKELKGLELKSGKSNKFLSVLGGTKNAALTILSLIVVLEDR